MNRLDLTGRRAVVTGAASGIGRAIALRLAASGARVCAWDRSADGLDRLAASMEVRHAGLCVDMADEARVIAAVKETVRLLGGIDILVNNAGITGPNLPLQQYESRDWRQVFEVNVHGTFVACREVVAHMVQGKAAGRIVNVASVAGKEGNPNASAYSASKAAVIAMTKSLGKELAETQIRVNCVTPAAVETPLFAQMSAAHVEYMLSKIPMRRFGSVDEVAAMVAWLCTQECSFSTGAVFDLSGGRATY